ncbi:MAG: hypothetical protein Q8Q35_01130 [Nanoarchaeota archaeon]|nr:hypothetical protein [Nanoarchaeota archaeon]
MAEGKTSGEGKSLEGKVSGSSASTKIATPIKYLAATALVSLLGSAKPTGYETGNAYSPSGFNNSYTAIALAESRYMFGTNRFREDEEFLRRRNSLYDRLL